MTGGAKGGAARNYKKRSPSDVVWSTFFWCTLFVAFNCALFSGFTSSTFRFIFHKTFQPLLVLTWPAPSNEAISGHSSVTISVREVVMFPDQAVVFLNYPRTTRFFTKEDLHCVYFSANNSTSSTTSRFTEDPVDIDGGDPHNQIVRCPIMPRGLTVSVGLKPSNHVLTVPSYNWDRIAYDALIDRDNTTIVFVKGLKLRRERLSIASKFECVYGWDFRSTRYLLRTDVVSIAQEIVRCKTPKSVLSFPRGANNSVKVSVRVKGIGPKGIFDTIARPGSRPGIIGPPLRKDHEMCLCSMVRNQGRFLKEWVMYHARMGVQRWFLYDNNSDDETDAVIESLQNEKYNVTRHVWPWIKTQEAGFAHCALRARETCQWVGFIDVDEFFHMPSGLLIHDVLRNQSNYDYVGEIRASCYSFGPSGLKQIPKQGVTVGYTCRIAGPERHKSIVRPEALNATLINVVHHFHLSNGYEAVDVDKGVMVINHYKYQVWGVFKEKFYRRVATYVADWQEDENVGSKDRAPGLGTRAVEPPDWSSRFCDVRDTGLRDRVLDHFVDPKSQLLPWQEEDVDDVQKQRNEEEKKVERRKHRVLL